MDPRTSADRLSDLRHVQKLRYSFSGDIRDAGNCNGVQGTIRLLVGDIPLNPFESSSPKMPDHLEAMNGKKSHQNYVFLHNPSFSSHSLLQTRFLLQMSILRLHLVLFLLLCVRQCFAYTEFLFLMGEGVSPLYTPERGSRSGSQVVSGFSSLWWFQPTGY